MRYVSDCNANVYAGGELGLDKKGLKACRIRSTKEMLAVQTNKESCSGLGKAGSNVVVTLFEKPSCKRGGGC